ncbi:PaaI family thioesterase [Sphingomonas xinjiangensis]|uniref:Uncharacterized protein (TIGR00369 family) n=1 Tax=Sphingomonas xinjiangensis TaxID=643568 RepID=A0A840YG80_9SPHN|nr:PaaI family thioesterase [Sphingomonas xinjiangensis]MBB5711844.1 uncharacterized protein (TIGR00369 family) [Sphingomonas xinjiangensis]
MEIARSFLGAGRPPGIGEALDFRLLEVEVGYAACGGTLGPHAMNATGFVHGGYIATLLDTACGFAVLSKLSADQTYTTIELKAAYHKGLKPEVGFIRAEGRVVTIGRRVAFAEAKLLDPAGTLYATGTSSLLIMER